MWESQLKSEELYWSKHVQPAIDYHFNHPSCQQERNSVDINRRVLLLPKVWVDCWSREPVVAEFLHRYHQWGNTLRRMNQDTTTGHVKIAFWHLSFQLHSSDVLWVPTFIIKKSYASSTVDMTSTSREICRYIIWCVNWSTIIVVRCPKLKTTAS